MWDLAAEWGWAGSAVPPDSPYAVRTSKNNRCVVQTARPCCRCVPLGVICLRRQQPRTSDMHVLAALDASCASMAHWCCRLCDTTGLQPEHRGTVSTCDAQVCLVPLHHRPMPFCRQRPLQELLQLMIAESAPELPPWFLCIDTLAQFLTTTPSRCDHRSFATAEIQQPCVSQAPPLGCVCLLGEVPLMCPKLDVLEQTRCSCQLAHGMPSGLLSALVNTLQPLTVVLPVVLHLLSCRDKLITALQARGFTACCCHVEVRRNLHI